MTQASDHVTVQIKYRELVKTFSGNPEQVWLLLNGLFSELIPSFEIARRLMLDIDLQTLVRDCERIIAFSEEGPNILVSRDRITDNETLALLLLANYIGHKLGRLPGDSLSKEELQTKLGKDAKITSTRLGELVKNETITRTADDRYRISTFGVIQTQKNVLPKIKARVGL